jgi:hypothetical protein
MPIGEAIGYQFLDGLPDQLFPRVSENRLGLMVDHPDLPVGADPDNRIRGELE